MTNYGGPDWTYNKMRYIIWRTNDGKWHPGSFFTTIYSWANVEFDTHEDGVDWLQGRYFEEYNK